MTRLVFSYVKAPVEKIEMTAAQTSAGHHVLIQRILTRPRRAMPHYSSL